MLPLLSLFLLFLSSVVHAAAILPRQGKTPAFFLAGDSTTAPQSAGGGGWGDGFLSILTNGATGKNFGRNGQTTVSFQKSGVWEKVMESVKASADKNRVFVTIQVRLYKHQPVFQANFQLPAYCLLICSLVWPQRPEER